VAQNDSNGDSRLNIKELDGAIAEDITPKMPDGGHSRSPKKRGGILQSSMSPRQGKGGFDWEDETESVTSF
jgi:hypothetical protein